MMIPLGISGGFQVMVILKKEGSGVMTTGPGTGRRYIISYMIYVFVIYIMVNNLTIFFCLYSYGVTVGSYIILLIHSSYLNGVVGEGSQSSQ